MSKETVLRHILSNNKLIAIVHEFKDWDKGLHFLTSDEEFLQAGTWWYDKGHVLDKHYHNILPRESNITQECIVVLQGSVKVDLYGHKQEYLESFTLSSSEFAILISGGHGYQILENDTKILETKNGPFLGVHSDKTRF